MITIIQKLLGFLDSRSRSQLYLLLIPMLVIAVMEMASIGMIIPLVQITSKGSEADLLAYLPASLIAMDLGTLIIAAGATFILFFLAKNMLILGMVYIITRFTQRKLAQFSQRMFNLYLSRDYTFYVQRNSAEIIRNLSTTASTCFDGLRLILTIAMDLVLSLAALILLLGVEPLITLTVGLFLCAAGYILYRILAPFLSHWGGRAYFFEAKAIQSVNQGIGAIKDIKVLNCQSNIAHTFSEQTDNLAKYGTRSITANQFPRLFVETLVVTACVIVVVILFHVYQSVDQILATMGLFGMAALRLMPSMNRILGSANEIRQRTVLIDALFQDLMEGTEEAEFDPLLSDLPPLQVSEIELKDVCYSYPESTRMALNNISLKIRKGTTVGLVGESGAGKTTLVDTLLGLLEPDHGHLYVDGKDAFEDIRKWRSHLGFVPQTIYLLDDTLRRNIAFGVLDEDIDEDAIARCLRISQLDSVIKQLPQGTETPIGEQGVRLSGGQRQRVGIARALYRDPDILVLDEATSSLDSQTEWEVSNAIDALAGQKTLIIIAHRLSTVSRCDKLVFLKGGQITDIGSFDDMLERCEDFQQLVALQLQAP